MVNVKVYFAFPFASVVSEEPCCVEFSNRNVVTPERGLPSPSTVISKGTVTCPFESRVNVPGAVVESVAVTVIFGGIVVDLFFSKKYPPIPAAPIPNAAAAAIAFLSAIIVIILYEYLKNLKIYVHYYLHFVINLLSVIILLQHMDNPKFIAYLRTLKNTKDYTAFNKLKDYFNRNINDFAIEQQDEASGLIETMHTHYNPKNCRNVKFIGLITQKGEAPINLSHDESQRDCTQAQIEGYSLPDYLFKYYPNIYSYAITSRADEIDEQRDILKSIFGSGFPTMGERAERSVVNVNPVSVVENKLKELEENLDERIRHINESISDLATYIKRSPLPSVPIPNHQREVIITIPSWLYRQISNPKVKFPYAMNIVRTNKSEITVRFIGADSAAIDTELKPYITKHEEEIFLVSSKKTEKSIKETETYKHILANLERRYKLITGYAANSAFMGLVARITRFLRDNNLEYDLLNLDFDLFAKPKRQYTAENATEAFAEFIKVNDLSMLVRDAMGTVACDKEMLYQAITELYALYALVREGLQLNREGELKEEELKGYLAECSYPEDLYPQLYKEADTDSKNKSNGQSGILENIEALLKRYRKEYTVK